MDLLWALIIILTSPFWFVLALFAIAGIVEIIQTILGLFKRRKK